MLPSTDCEIRIFAIKDLMYVPSMKKERKTTQGFVESFLFNFFTPHQKTHQNHISICLILDELQV